MSQEIQEYFKNDRSWEAGIILYNKLPNKMHSMARSFMRMNGSKKDIDILHYELWKHTNKPARLLSVTLSNTLKNIIDTDVESSGKVTPINSPLTDKTTNLDISSFTEENKKELATNAINSAKDLEKASIKIRDQFPFLKQDPCPILFKVLVGDLITAFEQFKAAHAHLFTEVPEKNWYEIAKEVQTKYHLRKEIFAELDHYQKTGKILGKHPIFVREASKETLRNTPTIKLSKRVETLDGNIRRNKLKLKDQKGKTAENTKARLENQNWELKFIKQLLENR